MLGAHRDLRNSSQHNKSGTGDSNDMANLPPWMFGNMHLQDCHLEDEKTPIAEQTMINQKFKTSPSPSFENKNIHSQGSPFTRLLTPRARFAGGSNTSTPRSDHGEFSSNSASASYFTDTSGTSGISSGTDELHDLMKSVLSLRNSSSGNPSSGASFSATGRESQSQSQIFSNTSSSLIPINELEALCENLFIGKPSSPKLESERFNSASLCSSDLLLEELLSQQHLDLQKHMKEQNDFQEIQQILGGSIKNSISGNVNPLLLPSQSDPFPSLSNIDQLRLIIQNQELVRALAALQTQSGANNSMLSARSLPSPPPSLPSMGNVLHSAPPMKNMQLPRYAHHRNSPPLFRDMETQSGPMFRMDSMSNTSGTSHSGPQDHNPMISDQSTCSDVNQLAMTYKLLYGPMEQEIEKAAHIYRNSASIVAQRSDAAYHWSGKLPPKNYRNVTFSRKVFLGGVPWEITAEELVATFRNFGEVSVIWPNREKSVSSLNVQGHKGFCYIVFEHELSVKMLLDNCVPDVQCNGAYFRMCNLKYKSKDVQVIPWVVNDSSYVGVQGAKPDPKKTVFVGALHGMITAEVLFNVMNDLFGNVVMTALDTDKYKYPIGSGRVIFGTKQSYVRAVTANFVEVRTSKFKKTIQIDPYLEDSMCNNCFYQPGFYFCRSFECFRYFCPRCWQVWHSNIEMLNHKPLRRSFRSVSATNNDRV